MSRSTTGTSATAVNHVNNIRFKPSGHYVYRQFNIRQFYVVPTQCILCGSDNKQRLFPYTALTDWFL